MLKLARGNTITMRKLYPKFGVLVNTVQIKKMSGSVIFLELQILVVLVSDLGLLTITLETVQLNYNYIAFEQSN